MQTPNLFDLFLSFGEGGKRLSAYLANRLNQLHYEGWKQPAVRAIGLNFSDDATNIQLDSEWLEDMGGSGRVAEKAIAYYQEKRDKIRNWLYETMNANIPRNIWVTSCLGGGVGTGSVALGMEDLLNWVSDYNQVTQNQYSPAIWLLLTIPKKTEGANLKRTAFRYLNQLIEQYIKQGKINGAFLIDNGTAEGLYGDHKGEGMWDSINEGIFQAFKNLYTFPFRDDIDWTAGYKRYDFNDLWTTLNFGKGFIDIRKSTMDLASFREYIEWKNDPQNKDLKAPDVPTSSLICSSQDINTTKRFATIVGVPKSWKEDPELGDYAIDFADHVIRTITRKAKCNDFINSNYVSDDLEQLEAITICSGMPLSQKIYRLVNEVVRELTKDKAKQEVDTLDLSSLTDL